MSESATLAVDAKAKALVAAGRPVIGFGAGEPDFPTPEYIVSAAVDACRDPRWHRYSPAGGLPALKEAVAHKTLRDSGWEIGADQVLVTNGGKQALYNTFAALLNPGDEVLLPAPFWTTYPESISLAGGVPVEGEDDLPLHLIVVHQQASQHLDVICPESGAARRDSSRHSGEVTGHDVGVALDNDRLLVL